MLLPNKKQMIFAILIPTVVMRTGGTCSLPSQATLTSLSGTSTIYFPCTSTICCFDLSWSCLLYFNIQKGPSGCWHGHDNSQTKSCCKVRNSNKQNLLNSHRRRIKRTLSLHPSSPRALFNELLLASNQKQGEEGLAIGRKLLSFPEVNNCNAGFSQSSLFCFAFKEHKVPSGRDDAWSVHTCLQHDAPTCWILPESAQVWMLELVEGFLKQLIDYSALFFRSVLETTSSCLQRPRFLSGAHRFW